MMERGKAKARRENMTSESSLKPNSLCDLLQIDHYQTQVGTRLDEYRDFLNILVGGPYTRR